jgi:hydroxypyruvate reductase
MQRLDVVEAAHPVPDAAGRDAARRIYDLVQGLTKDDLVLCLISGGGSALLALPAEGVSLEDKQAVNKALLKSGATISEMNTVRKHLSAIKGGRLAAAASPAKVIALMISDVPGDDPSIIASGPTVPDPSSNRDALGIIAKYKIDVPESVLARLKTADETPKPGDSRLAAVENVMIATPQASLEAAAAVARKAGVKPVILGDSIEGESRDVALVHAGIARQCAMRGQPEAPPCVLISGGETTITLKGKGKGGRNTEFLLALAIALDRLPIPTASTARRTMPAPSSRRTRFSGPKPLASTPRPCLPTTIPGRSSMASAICSSPAPRSPTSTISAPCWWRRPRASAHLVAERPWQH